MAFAARDLSPVRVPRTVLLRLAGVLLFALVQSLTHESTASGPPPINMLRLPPGWKLEDPLPPWPPITSVHTSDLFPNSSPPPPPTTHTLGLQLD